MLCSGGSDGYYGDEMNLAAKLGEDMDKRDDILLTEGAKRALTSTYEFISHEVSVSGLQISYYKLCEN